MTGRETALSVVVPEAEPVVADFRRRFDVGPVGRRVPPHVTLLYPFVDAGRVDDALIAALEDFYRPVESFPFELTRIGRFEAHVWLAPEPREPFVELILRTSARFPEQPPYGGEFAGSEPEPHLTVGQVDGEHDLETIAAAAERELTGRLPVPCHAHSVSLLEEQPDGTWAKRADLPFEGR